MAASVRTIHDPTSTNRKAVLSIEIEVRNVMFIAGRGTVVVGHARNGIARAGQVTEPLALGAAAGRRLEISAVERLSSMEARGQGVGVVFRDPPPLNELKRALPPGSILLLEDPDESGMGGT
ncbi:MAG: hypothetical protein IPO58_22845 [Betaproteobacteria bacterium]|nr:hypothetical protein [Betaproteobacteria bacterium]MBK8740774.1 hypothetical protein [Betaproteobacteria bacterium]MBK9609115.1 hypothetical protein [Betaproteobacteria bacterium]